MSDSPKRKPRQRTRGSDGPRRSARERPPEDPRISEDATLWTRAREGNDDAIEQLVGQHERVAVSMAKAHEGRGIKFADLLDQARHGLRLAVFRFRPERSDNFQAFANTVVRNHLADLFRKRSFRTRHEREQSAKYEEAKVQLGHELGRSPTDDETYNRLDWSDTRRRNHAFAEQRRKLASIATGGDAAEQSQIDVAASPPPEDRGASRLEVGMERLDEMDRRVIMDRFYSVDCPSQKQTAERLGITEYRERQFEERALRELERFLDSTEPADDSGARSKD